MISDTLIIPDGCIDIMASMKDGMLDAKVYGMIDKNQVISVKPDVRYLGLRIDAQFAVQLLNTSMKDLTKQIVDLVDVSKESYHFIEQALSKKDMGEQIKVLQDGFIKQLTKGTPNPYALEWALSRIKTCQGNISVKQLAQEMNYSEVYIRKLFQKHLGINAKSYMTITRYQRALERIIRQPHLAIIDVIQSLGYYNDAHFIRESKRITGLTPRELSNVFNSIET